MIQVQNHPYMQVQQLHLKSPTVAKPVHFMAGVFSPLNNSSNQFIPKRLFVFLALFLFSLTSFFLSHGNIF